MIADEFCSPPDDYILLGKVGKPQGLHGEIRITCFSEQPENVANYKTLYFTDSKGDIVKGLPIIKSRVKGKAAIVLLEGISSRSMVEKLHNATVLVAKSELPETEADAFYYYQFQGKQVITRDGVPVGRVNHIFNNGAQDILVIGAGKEEILIPVTKNIVVQETDEALIVDVPPGLLELNRQSS